MDRESSGEGWWSWRQKRRRSEKLAANTPAAELARYRSAVRGISRNGGLRGKRAMRLGMRLDTFFGRPRASSHEDAAQNERETHDRRPADRLVEEDRAVEQGDAGREIADQRGPAGADLGDQPVEDHEGQGGPDGAEG